MKRIQNGEGNEEVTKWFKMWAATWLSDPAVVQMSYTTQGVYMKLLCLCWVNQGFEGGESLEQLWCNLRKVLNRFGKVQGSSWRLLEASLQPHFERQSDGRWWNKRLWREWHDACAARARTNERDERTRNIALASQKRTNGRTAETEALRHRLCSDHSLLGLQGTLRRHGPGQVVGLGWKRQDGGRVLWSDLGAQDLAEINSLAASMEKDQS